MVNTSGTYYFRAYNTCGWGPQGSASVTINTTTPSAVTVAGGGTFCNQVTLTASGGGGGTIYWQGTTNNGTSTAIASSSQVVSASGIYYFRAYNACGWGPQGSATVTINTTPEAVTVSGGGTSCNPVTLTAGGGDGGTIYWQGTTSNGTSTSFPSSSEMVSTSGTYYFRAYNACGWGPEGSATVTINTTPEAVTVSGSGASCNQATLTASGGSGGTIYWQGTTNNGTSGNIASASQVVSASGTYYFRAYNACGWGPQGSATVTINSTTPSAVTVAGGGTFCNQATLTASGGGGGTIYWQGTTNNGTSRNIASASQVVSASGTYYFRAYNACGWGSQGSAAVTINSTTPSAVTVAGGGTSCGTATLTASGGSGGTIYWQGTTRNGTSTATASSSQVVSTSGTYYFRANNSSGWGPQDSAIVTINTTPAAVTVTIGGTTCGTATLTASGGGGGTIYWQGTTNNGTSTATASTSQVVNSSGTYYFRAHNTCGWGPQGSATVTINAAPGPVSISGGGTFCNTATLAASGGNGGTIYWQGTTRNGTSTATASSSQMVSTSGTYYFRANNSCGWGPQDSTMVIINTVPAAVKVSGGGIFCNPVTLTASGGGGDTIYWQGTTSNGTSKATASASQVVSTSGTYYFRANNTCGWGPQDSAIVTINTVPAEVTVSGGGTSCNPLTLTASGGGGGTIYWQGTTRNGTSTTTASSSQVVSTSGPYYFRANNTCGWGPQDSAIVTINTVPAAVKVSGGGTFCNPVTLTASGGSGGTIYWQGTTRNGTSTATASASQMVSTSGTYYFRANNTCGWGAQDSVTVSISAPSISPMGNNTVPASGVSNASVAVTAVPGCSWTSSNNGYSWITINSSGVGNGTAVYSVLPNDTSSSRTAVIAIAGQPFTITQAGLPSCNYSDSLVLVALYIATQGTGWANKTNWLVPGKPISTWAGITINNQGCVADILLWQNQLSGSLPKELGNLLQLRRLELGFNQISGNIPQELGNMTQLEYLSLSYNNLSGSIPSQLGNLSLLQELRLSGNQLSGSIPSQLGNLTKLRNLYLSINQLSGNIPSQLGNLSQLSYLYLNNNQLSGSIPPQLVNLSQLLILDFSINQLSGNIPSELRSLSKLLILDLSVNRLSGNIPPQLGNLSQLLILDLSINQLSGSIPSQLANLSKLHTLPLGFNQLNGSIPPELGNLPDLTHLFLNNNQLSGSIPRELGNMPNLQTLELNNNQLSGCFPDTFKKLCGKNIRVFENPKLPWQGDFSKFCAELAQVGAVCNDINSATSGEVIQPDCSCALTPCTVPGAVSVTGGGYTCNSATLTASNGSDGTIYWQGTSSVGTSLAESVKSKTVTESGTYYFRANNTCGWGAAGSVSVTIGKAPGPITVNIKTSTCTSVTLNAVGGSNDTIYWQGVNKQGVSTSFPGNEQTVVAPGTYYFRAHNTCGWGTEGSITIPAIGIDNTVEITGSHLTAKAVVSSYQWIDCSTLLPIPGEKGRSFKPSKSGTYAVEMTEGNCTVRSKCEVLVNLENTSITPIVLVFPNPTTGSLTIESTGLPVDDYKIILLNTLGQTLKEKDFITTTEEAKTELDISESASGFYFLSIRSEKFYKVFKVQKM